MVELAKLAKIQGLKMAQEIVRRYVDDYETSRLVRQKIQDEIDRLEKM